MNTMTAVQKAAYEKLPKWNQGDVELTAERDGNGRVWVIRKYNKGVWQAVGYYGTASTANPKSAVFRGYAEADIKLMREGKKPKGFDWYLSK